MHHVAAKLDELALEPGKYKLILRKGITRDKRRVTRVQLDIPLKEGLSIRMALGRHDFRMEKRQPGDREERWTNLRIPGFHLDTRHAHETGKDAPVLHVVTHVPEEQADARIQQILEGFRAKGHSVSHKPNLGTRKSPKTVWEISHPGQEPRRERE